MGLVFSRKFKEPKITQTNENHRIETPNKNTNVQLYLEELKLNAKEWNSIKLKFTGESVVKNCLNNNNESATVAPSNSSSRSSLRTSNRSRCLTRGSTRSQRKPLGIDAKSQARFYRDRLFNKNNFNNQNESVAAAIEEEEEELIPVSEFPFMNHQLHEKVAAQYPLGMHIVNEFFNYHFYVPDCFQSRVDFIEVNHIPVSDIHDLKELKDYLCQRGWTSSAQEADLLQKAAKDTNRMRKIISLKCKFDIELKVSDFFWSNRGMKVRAYGIIGPTWTSVFSAFCYFEQSVGFCKSMITTDLKSDVFIDKVIANNKYYCPQFHNIDEYCFGQDERFVMHDDYDVCSHEGEEEGDYQGKQFEDANDDQKTHPFGEEIDFQMPNMDSPQFEDDDE